jgi:peptide methionine sulfoxide reductase msrA/msrB
MKLNNLNKEEKRVIVEKGTEAPFSGEYDKHSESGIYVCRWCGAYLYRSDDKFDSGCGWPSFDDEIKGSVKRKTDADGRRVEITCERCGGHLGHVFEGEKLTDKNTRHCVNSVSMKFLPENESQKEKTIYLGAGCFWCTEAVFKMISGVKSVEPGYAGGELENPTYEDVGSGSSGHAEVAKIIFDPQQVSLEYILGVFMEAHDPTSLNQQGADKGTQYRSAIYTENENDLEIVENYIEKNTQKHLDKYSKPIVTEIAELSKIGTGKYYPAESYHHKYYENHKDEPYCEVVIAPKVEKIKKKFN